MSLGVMAKITADQPSSRFRHWWVFHKSEKKFPRFLPYLSIFIFSMGLCNLGFALLLVIFLGQSLNFSDIPCRLVPMRVVGL